MQLQQAVSLMFPKYPYNPYILRLNGISSPHTWSIPALFSPSNWHKLTADKLGTRSQPSHSACWWKESPQDHMEAEAQVEPDALVPPPVWSRLQQQCEVETSVHWPVRHEWSLSAWNASVPVLSKLQKGVKTEYSRSTRCARASPLLDLAHP